MPVRKLKPLEERNTYAGSVMRTFDAMQSDSDPQFRQTLIEYGKWLQELVEATDERALEMIRQERNRDRLAQMIRVVTSSPV